MKVTLDPGDVLEVRFSGETCRVKIENQFPSPEDGIWARKGGRMDPEIVRTTPKTRMLILSCSARKTGDAGLIPALDRYDGQFFRVFKKALRDGHAENVQLAILSARFGLLNTYTLIPDYDQRMTPEQCKAEKATIQHNLELWLGDTRYSEIFVNLGKEYLPLVEGMPGLATATFAAGQIGERAHQLKEWLRSQSHH